MRVERWKYLLATHEGEEKQFSSRMRFCKIDRENTEHGAKHVAMALRQDSGIDRPRNVPSPPPLGEPHRITSPTLLQLVIRDTGTPASLACWLLLPFPKIHGVSLGVSMTQIGGVPNDF